MSFSAFSMKRLDAGLLLREVKTNTRVRMGELFLQLDSETQRVDLKEFLDRLSTLIEESPRNNRHVLNRLDSQSNISFLGILCSRASTPEGKDSCIDDIRLQLTRKKTKIVEKYSRRITYRKHSENVLEKEVDLVMEAIETYYEDRCQSPYLNVCRGQKGPTSYVGIVPDTLLYSSPYQYQRIVSYLRDIGQAQDCLKSALEMTALKWKRGLGPFEGMPQTSQGLRGGDLAAYNNMVADITFINTRVEQMLEEFRPEQDGLFLEESPQPFCSDLKKSSLGIIEGAISDIQDALDCRLYSSGEERTLRDSTYGDTYRVKKERDGEYIITIPTSFVIGEGLNAYNKDSDKLIIHESTLNHVNSCLASASSAMLGPQGEEVKVVLVDDEGSGDLKDSCKSPLNPPIAVHSPSARPGIDSRNYHLRTHCSVIVHETLHRFGIVDEYPTSFHGLHVDITSHEVIHASKVGKDYRCRITHEDTVMSAGLRSRFKESTMGNGVSLLEPIYFQMMLYGSCNRREDIRLYRECAQLADKQFTICPPLKQKCEALDILGRSSLNR